MALDVGYVSAIGAGALSFLSPCVLPLVPPYLCYMAGVSVEDFRAEAAASAKTGARTALIVSSLAFVLGFTTVFVALGAGASTIGRLLRVWQEPLAIAAGILIILMGLNFLGVIRIPLLSREARFQSQGKPASAVAAYIMGLAFAFGWTPCIGPVLSVILGVAGTRDTVASGALLLAVYSLGLGIPFIAAGLFAGPFMRWMKRFRGHIGKVEKAMGALLVVTGVLFVTGQITTIAFWMLSVFPGLAQLG
jgi:cytochrome c-type biogenesis protein